MSVSAMDSFDSVVMLTWSDWHTEPRSNRYHYAIRFARRWPVFFVQVNGSGDEIVFEPVAGHDITLVRIAPDYGPAQSARLAAALRDRGVVRPLVWLYNLYLAEAVARLHPALVAYHATEDYIAKADKVAITQSDISRLAIAVVQRADFVVAVSEGVAKTHRPVSSGPVLVLPNGCDFDFWSRAGASAYVAPAEGKVALFQGGINGRLDFALLERLSELLPHWQFWFCGKAVDGGADWERLQKRPNVVYRGFLDSDGIAALAKQALVGLIPFKDSDLMRRSLPLKAYEYLACGLPVVTTPVDALAGQDELFTLAGTAEDFASAIERLAPSREEPAVLARRLEAAKRSSYDARFQELLGELGGILQQRTRQRPSLNVLMLYDDQSTHVSTIAEHLDAFRAHSHHRFHFLPATNFVALADEEGAAPPDLSCYDAVALHYSVRLSVSEHLSPGVAAMVAAYHGPKLLFIQDEYDQVETTRHWMERLGIDAVFTNVPLDMVDKVYPRARFPKVDFIATLTGYVPEDPAIDGFVRPMAGRDLRIAYRGRVLPYQYGALAREKFTIGVEMRRLAAERGVSADIEVDEDKRIYGADWYRFIGSARATLGTESGSNVFDMDGRLAELAREHAELSFEQFAEAYLGEHEGLVRMNQISPKIFEAIRLRTALVLFEGEYSGVVRANEHYIPLKKDYSNVGEVFAWLEDTPFLEAMTERAYRDVIASGRYTLRSFVAEVDAYLSRRALGRRRATIVSVPLVALYSSEDADLMLTGRAHSMLLNDAVLRPGFGRLQLLGIGEGLFKGAKAASEGGQPVVDLRTVSYSGYGGRGSFAFRVLRKTWHVLPPRWRAGILARARTALQEDDKAAGFAARGIKRLWRLARPQHRARSS